MGRYKRFLYTEENIPRSIACRRRQRAAHQRVSLEYRNSHNLDKNAISFVTTSTSQEDVERTGTILKENYNFMSVNRVTNDPGASCSLKSNVNGIYDVITNMTESTESDFSSNSNGGIREIASHSLLKSSESISSSERDLRSILLSEEDSLTNNTSSDPEDSANEDCLHVETKNKKLSDRLCDCTNTTVGDVVFMCLVLGVRHNLTWEAQLDILRMVNSIYDNKNIPETKYKYFQYIEKEKESICYHIYCPTCEVYLGEKSCLPESVYCSYCASNIDVSNPSNFFLSISLESQLQKLVTQTAHNIFKIF